MNPDFQTKVVWVSSWYDPAKEADAAKALFDQGADIIAQHTDSPAALQVAEQRGLMAFGQAWDMSSFAPNAHLTAIENNWGVYYIDRIQKMLDGKWESADTWWGFKEGILKMAPFNKSIPAEVVSRGRGDRRPASPTARPRSSPGRSRTRPARRRSPPVPTLDDAGAAQHGLVRRRACRAEPDRRPAPRAAGLHRRSAAVPSRRVGRAADVDR